jgi:hypothetical protein
MDSELGFFFGAYIAEGHAVKRASRAAHASATSRSSSTTLRPTDRILRLIEAGVSTTSLDGDSSKDTVITRPQQESASPARSSEATETFAVC